MRPGRIGVSQRQLGTSGQKESSWFIPSIITRLLLTGYSKIGTQIPSRQFVSFVEKLAIVNSVVERGLWETQFKTVVHDHLPAGTAG
jgi:hypothetical protein